MQFIWAKPENFDGLISELKIDDCLATLMHCKARIVDLDRDARLVLPTDFFKGVGICEEKTWKIFYCPADYLRIAPETLWRGYFYRELELIANKLRMDLGKLGPKAYHLPEARVLIDSIFATAADVPFDKRGRLTVPEELRELAELKNRCWLDFDMWGIYIEDLQKRTQRIKQSASDLRSKLSK